jgi:hypothetical protein
VAPELFGELALGAHEKPLGRRLPSENSNASLPSVNTTRASPWHSLN